MSRSKRRRICYSLVVATLFLAAMPSVEASGQLIIRERESHQPRYSGAKINLSFQSIEVRRLLQIIADFASVNIVVSDSVQGSAALRLMDVPWDQALDIVLQTQGLDQWRQGNVIMVDAAATIAARRQASLQQRAEREQLEPLQTLLLTVSYARADELAAVIAQAGGGLSAAEIRLSERRGVAPSIGVGSSGLISERGSLVVDQRSNTLIITETAERLRRISLLVKRLDVPVRQVLIESRIVVANDDFSRDLGVRFGATGGIDSGAGTLLLSGSQGAVNSVLQSGPLGEAALLAPTVSNNPAADSGRLAVNLPASNAAGRFGIGFLAPNILIDLELSAIQAEGRGELISHPRVVTMDQQQAVVEQGEEIPFQESTSSGATSTSFKKAVLSLVVTPQITADDRILLDLAVTADSRGAIAQGGAPAINTREIRTKVLVNDGQTIVLGGIYQEEQRSSVQKVPVLGDVPLMGRLFRRNSKLANKRELLVFVTPKILNDQGMPTTSKSGHSPNQQSRYQPNLFPGLR